MLVPSVVEPRTEDRLVTLSDAFGFQVWLVDAETGIRTLLEHVEV